VVLHPPLSPLAQHRDNVTVPHGRPNLRSWLHSCYAQEGGPRSPQRTCGGIGNEEEFWDISTLEDEDSRWPWNTRIWLPGDPASRHRKQEFSAIISVCIYSTYSFFFLITDEEDSPVIRGFSDDEPLVIAWMEFPYWTGNPVSAICDTVINNQSLLLYHA